MTPDLTPRLLYAEAVAFVAFELRVNDVPIARLAPGDDDVRGFFPLPAYVVRGDNEVSVSLDAPFRPPVDAQGRPLHPDRVWLRVRVARFADGDPGFEDEGETLADLVWSPLVPGRSKAVRFQSPQGPPSWSWSRAEPLDPSPATAQSAFDFVQRLAAAYMAGDPSPLVAAADPKIQDMALAYPHHGLAGVRTIVADAASSPEPRLPAPPVEFSPRVCAGGRLFDCVGEDGRPYLRARKPDGDFTFLRLIVGRFRGQWQVVR